MRLWGDLGVTGDEAGLDVIVDRFLLTPGNIHRAAPIAVAGARADGRTAVTPADVATATRTLNRQSLEILARPLDPLPTTDPPVLTAAAEAELRTLVMRCRHRERLTTVTRGSHSGLNRGVRAMFSGPSGTGKTLVARHLAATLGLDVFRVDLAAVVNKYIGETERNLDKLLGRAEELDVLLLLDEGDALMTRRTDVGNANDRYANLETNFLLQRLETFEGIVVVTTNMRQPDRPGLPAPYGRDRRLRPTRRRTAPTAVVGAPARRPPDPPGRTVRHRAPVRSDRRTDP